MTAMRQALAEAAAACGLDSVEIKRNLLNHSRATPHITRVTHANFGEQPTAAQASEPLHDTLDEF
jgi:hypothetical protein